MITNVVFSRSVTGVLLTFISRFVALSALGVMLCVMLLLTHYRARQAPWPSPNGSIETAKHNGVEPQAWLTDVLRRIAEHKINRIDEATAIQLQYR